MKTPSHKSNHCRGAAGKSLSADTPLVLGGFLSVLEIGGGTTVDDAGVVGRFFSERVDFEIGAGLL